MKGSGKVALLLSDFICPSTNVNRSVNIERDMGSDSVIEHYRLTQKGLHIIDRFVGALEADSISSWSLTGPYGMGKSSFLSFMIALCGRQNETRTVMARDRLLVKSPKTLQRLIAQLEKHSVSQSGFFRVPIVSSYQSATRSVAQGLISALYGLVYSSESPDFRIDFEYNRLRESFEADRIEAQQILQSLTSISNILKSPIVIAIDEFGKSLEFMAHYPDEGDIHVIQSMAESRGLHLFVSLHQAFEEYSA